MQAVIRMRAKELNSRLFKKIKDLVKDRKDLDITISIQDKNEAFFNKLDQSINQLNKGGVTFTMEEFVDYVPASKSK